jgi:hypothetical protein
VLSVEVQWSDLYESTYATRAVLAFHWACARFGAYNVCK